MKNKKNTDKTPESKIKKRLKEWISSPFSFLTLITVTALFILMLIIFLAEQSTNSQINTFFDAFWYTLVTITTVGYGDIAPASVTGRVAAMVLLLAGVAIFGSAFFTALNEGLTSALISFLRTLVFQIAAVLILPLVWKLDGIWMSIIVAEFMAVVVTVMFFAIKRKIYEYW